MKKDINSLIEKLKKISIQPIENISLLKKYLSKGFDNKEIIVFDWECPPRFVNYQDEKEFISYDVDLDKIFKGQKIDEFTELPRIITSQSKELKVLNLLKDFGLKIKFYKFIADLNADLIMPVDKKLHDRNKISEKFNQFKKMLVDRTANYPVETQTFLFSEFLKQNKLASKYKTVYKEWLDKVVEQDFVRKNVWREQVKRTEDHLGLNDKKQILEISRRTIASYAAEGAMFEILEKQNKKYIWINTEEVDRRTILITNLARTQKLPMIFPKK